MSNLKTWHLLSLLAIVCLATWLRTVNLNTQGILYGDAAHDLWSAQTAVETKQLPLLGIESSIPRFRQGPITVWLNMAVFALFGHAFLPYAIIYSLTTTLAVVALFWLVRQEVGTRPALLASFMLTISPLAVAHARVPFIITPLPLVLILWLWRTLKLREKSLSSLFWAFFTWGFLFQFELAITPLILVVVLEAWRHFKPLTIQKIAFALGGLLLGLSPQILHDLTHRGEQLGGFAAWIGYRVATAFIPTTDHALGFEKLKTAVGAIVHYCTKIVAIAPTPTPNLFALAFLFLALCGLALNLKKLSNIPALLRITTYSSLILLVAFIIHGSPSEAYFPPFLVLIPLSIASLWHNTENSHLKNAFFIMSFLLLGYHSLIAIQATAFFTDTSQHFNYGPSTGAQRQLVQVINSVTPNAYLNTTNPGGVFPNYFDNVKWLAAENGTPFSPTPSANLPLVWVEDSTSSLLNYPGAYIVYQGPYTVIWLP